MFTEHATTFELLPQRIDLIGFVLSFAGLGALLGSAYGQLLGVSPARRAKYAEDSALRCGALAAVIFLPIALLQALT